MSFKIQAATTPLLVCRAGYVSGPPTTEVRTIALIVGEAGCGAKRNTNGVKDDIFISQPFAKPHVRRSCFFVTV